MKILKASYNREIMDYLTDLYKAGYGYDKRVKAIMDEFDLDEETANGLVSDWTEPDEEDEVELEEASDEGHCVICGNPLTDKKYTTNMGEPICGDCHEKGLEGDFPKYCPKCGCEFMPGSGTCDSCGYECDESVKHVLVKEDATDNTKSRTESLKLTADYFLGQLRGLVDKVSKEDSEGAKLFFKNANNTLKDLVRQFEDLKANF